jgi:Protein of unknown function (DUF1059)
VDFRTACKGCGIEFHAATEDELIDQVQAHITERHTGGHLPSREQVRAVMRARSETEGKHPRVDPRGSGN